MSTVRVLNRLEKKLGRNFKIVFKSITVDNGCEFNNSNLLEKSIFNGRRTLLYYCHLYSSSERGSNEKQNQMIRRFIIKSTKIEDYSDNDIKQVQNWINDYPRNIFNFCTSRDKFTEELSNLGVKYCF